MNNVFLGVAPVHAEGVQLHQLPAVILIEPLGLVEEGLAPPERQGTAAVFSRGIDRVPGLQPLLHDLLRSRTQPIVEVPHHGWGSGRCHQEIFEISQDPGTNHTLFEIRYQIGITEIELDVEVIHPEVDQHLLQLPLAVHGPDEPGLIQLILLGLFEVGRHAGGLRVEQAPSHARRAGVHGKTGDCPCFGPSISHLRLALGTFAPPDAP